DHWKKPFYDC
ncbi:hypothetical protein CISIN_1g0201512mg, partial [Citrus sinensis]